MTKDDFALLAVIDAYKWWITTDFGFLKLTGAIDGDGRPTAPANASIDIARLRTIARAYSVSRNIPSDKQESQAQKIVEALAQKPSHDIFSIDVLARATALKILAESTPVTVTYEDGRTSQRELASAFSKLSWFIQPQGWTLFDKYVGAAVTGSDRPGLQQMWDFYACLAPTWSAVSTDICRKAGDAGLNPLLGYRIIDKYLFCHGLGMYSEPTENRKTAQFVASSTFDMKSSRKAVEAHRSSLCWTLEALGAAEATRLDGLARSAAPTLAKLPVFKP